MLPAERVPERRLRVRRKDQVKSGRAHINPQTMKELRIGESVEIVLVGKRRFLFKAVADSTVPVKEVWINSEDGRIGGIADNSIATVRRPIKRLI